MARKLKIDLAELDMAFVQGGPPDRYYLDLEDGEVVTISSAMHRDYQQLVSLARNQGMRLRDTLLKIDLPDWRKESALLIADQEQRLGRNVLLVPRVRSRNLLKAVFRFFESSPRYPGRVPPVGELAQAIRSATPRSPAPFPDKGTRRRALKWLAAQGIEPVD
jgi:hypothetical protein